METLAAIIIGPIVLLLIVSVLYCAGAILIDLFTDPRTIVNEIRKNRSKS